MLNGAAKMGGRVVECLSWAGRCTVGGVGEWASKKKRLFFSLLSRSFWFILIATGGFLQKWPFHHENNYLGLCQQT